MTMRNTFLPLLAVLLVGLLVIPASVTATDVSYYAYGDSVTKAATPYTDLNPDGSDCYIIQMRDLYDPNASADHNMDGGSKTSAWGLANIATHYDNETYYCIMFGLNDVNPIQGISAQDTLNNLLGMYNYANTENTTPIILIRTLSTPVPERPYREYAYAREVLTLIQEGLRAESIPFVRAYDAVDTVPGNCIIDEADTAYLVTDGVHLNVAGHRALADYLWASLQTPNAGFAANTTAAQTGDPVQFTSNSTGYPSLYQWSFGDGSSSQNESPVHTYAAPGTYSVSLTVTNVGGTDSVEYSDYITVVGEPLLAASFTADATTGPTPLTVKFTDTSIGAITSWLWNFGDGSTSTERNPTHTYTIPGTYTVSLNVSNSFNHNICAKADYITIAPGYYQTVAHSGCDLPTYQQDVIIHRGEGSAYEETADDLTTWHIYVGTNCRSDYGDIRFTDATGSDLAYYLWPDYTSSSARFTVRLEGADQGGALMIWYGNPTATTTSDGDATYYLHDHFVGDAPDTEKWKVMGDDASGTVSTSGGELCIEGSGADNTYLSVRSKTAKFGTGYSIEARMRQSGGGMGTYPGFGFTEGEFRYAPSCSDDQIAILDFVGRDSHLYGVNALHLADDKTYSSFSPAVGVSSEYRDFRISRKSSSARYECGASSVEISSDYSTSDMYVAMGFPQNDAGQSVYFDWILVRAYSATPPAAITFSGEQETAAPPVTAFTASPTAGLAPLTVQFTDTSTGSPTAWAWTFGDGGTSSEQNPQHTYTAPGLYTVTLTATNEYGSDYELKTDYITVYGPVTAQFTATPTAGLAPLTVQFTDLSTGGPTSWLWTFGDGNTSTDQNPQHTYTTAGTHTVTLTASHPYDSDTETKTAYITVVGVRGGEGDGEGGEAGGGGGGELCSDGRGGGFLFAAEGDGGGRGGTVGADKHPINNIGSLVSRCSAMCINSHYNRDLPGDWIRGITIRRSINIPINTV